MKLKLGTRIASVNLHPQVANIMDLNGLEPACGEFVEFIERLFKVQFAFPQACPKRLRRV